MNPEDTLPEPLHSPEDSSDDGGLRALEQEIDAAQQGDEAASIEESPSPAEPVATSDEITPEEKSRQFEDLTLAELLGQFWRAPSITVQGLIAVASIGVLDLPRGGRARVVERPAPPTDLPNSTISPSTTSDDHSEQAQSIGELIAEPVIDVADDPRRDWMHLGMYFSALVMGLWGSIILASGTLRTESVQLRDGLPFLVLAAIIWAGAETYRSWPWLKAWVEKRGWRQRIDLKIPPQPQVSLVQLIVSVHPVRVVAAVALPLLIAVTWVETRGNTFRFFGFWAWVLSILCVVIALAPRSWSMDALIPRVKAWWSRRAEGESQHSTQWVWIALIIILGVGIVFRLHDLYGMPPQMTSDHKEKLLDAWRVANGDRDVFFANNGGREGFQMYAIALMAQIPGLGFNHETMKLLAVIESVLALPAMFWLGRQVAGRENREFGNVLGLSLMALIAVSYWHVTVTRLALRIVLTPLVGALLLGFLVRAMRHNRRADFVAAGLVLGFGLYTYQAVRMMPVMVLVAVAIAILYRGRTRQEFLRYTWNLAALVIVSFTIFVPLARYSADHPEEFWRRSVGRVFGDRYDEDNTPVELTIGDRIEAFNENLPELMSNMRNALLMFNWKGDIGWINGVPNDPMLDPMSGTLLLVGVVACIAVAIRRRDMAFTLIPVAAMIMLLPSALAIGMTIENPSATRASGAIPPVYLMMAVALTLLIYAIRRVATGWSGRVAATGVISLILFASLVSNWNTYFREYREVYRFSTWPYSIPGDVLEGFVQSGGAFGNAFMLFYPSWWDYQIIGIEAGAMDWPNGIVDIPGLPRLLNNSIYCDGHPYPYDPNTDLLFLYHFEDDDTEAILEGYFPTGYSRLVETYNEPYNFKVYRVPALGESGFEALVEANVNEAFACARS